MRENKVRTTVTAAIILVVFISGGIGYWVYLKGNTHIPALEEPPRSMRFNQTAVPTIFAKTPSVPVVMLNWAYADQKSLRFDITISGMNSNLVASEWNWICDPYITTDERIPLSMSGFDTNRSPNQPGNPVERSYQYDLNGDVTRFKFLTANIDLTIGPCDKSLNLNETNITPSIPMDLISNYHLKFRVPID